MVILIGSQQTNGNCRNQAISLKTLWRDDECN